MVDTTVGEAALPTVGPGSNPLALDARDPGEIAAASPYRGDPIRDRPKIDALLANADRLA